MKRPSRPRIRQYSLTTGCFAGKDCGLGAFFTTTSGPHLNNAGEVIEREDGSVTRPST